jgi:uncharacterized protein
MRFLIDGYNLMHALGLMGQRFAPTKFHKARQRFLNDLAAALNAEEARQTTVVFDASDPPRDRPSQSVHKGITVIFATKVDSADECIEELIKSSSAPKNLTVVSSDHEIQRAARRRKAKTITSDAFCVELSARRSHKTAAPAPITLRPRETSGEKDAPSSVEASEWLREFSHLDDDPETKQALGDERPLLSDEDVRRIEREVDNEPF